MKSRTVFPAPQHCHVPSHLCAEHLGHVDHGKTNDRCAVGTGDRCPEEPQQCGSAHGAGQAGPGVPGAEVRQQQYSGAGFKVPQSHLFLMCQVVLKLSAP